MKEERKILEREFIYEIYNDSNPKKYPGTATTGSNKGFFRASLSGSSNGDESYPREELIELVEIGSFNNAGYIRMIEDGESGSMNHWPPTHIHGVPLKSYTHKRSKPKEKSVREGTDKSDDVELIDDHSCIDDTTWRQIKSRRGQAKFRKKLLEIHREKCVISDTNVINVLEAAHIVFHNYDTNYSPYNGLLLRADIHTLFDLNLIKIDIDTRINVHSSLNGTEYEQYNDQIIFKEVPAEMKANIKRRYKL
ncbi:hypothetical protein B7489_23240 [Vibrio alginolyticus]|uniref:HNH endonuclease n=1 Tax=Vibrio alginolyticus TaxID=663 RepID=UPI000A1FF9CC|nr:HNH endonuclease signature motif containing protein [Vibrio alginolyticus]OSP09044.1 hypothetical protein B7489_23240 [Vibrio alginolyticus]